MEAVAVRHALDGKNLCAPRFVGQESAGADRLAVDQDRAGPAYLQVTRTLGSFKAEPVPEEVQERQLGRDLQGNPTPIDCECDWDDSAVAVSDMVIRQNTPLIVQAND